MKKILLYLIITILCIFPVFGVATSKVASEWAQFCNDAQISCWKDDLTGVWYEEEGFGYTSSIALGQDLQPLFFDADNDSQRELIAVNGNTLYIYGVTEARNIVIEAEYNFPNSLDNMIATVTDHDGDDFVEIIVIDGDTNSNVTVVEYNQTNITIEATHQLPKNYSSGITCTPALGSAQVCFWTYDGGAGTDGSYAVWNMLNVSQAPDEITLTGEGRLFQNFDNRRRTAPAIVDIDPFQGDGEELVSHCSFGGVGETAGVCVVNLASEVLTWSEENGNGGFAANRGFGVSVFDLNGGNPEIVSAYLGDTKNYGIDIYSADGTRLKNHFDICSAGGAFTCYGSPPFFGDFINDATAEVCGVAYDTGTTESIMSCYSLVNDSRVFYYFDALGSNVFLDSSYEVQRPVTANLDDDRWFEVVLSDMIILDIDQDPSGANFTSIDFSPIMGDKKGNPALADANGDGLIDILYQKDDEIRLIYSTAENENAQLVGTYGQDFLEPICLNSTVTFYATECQTGAKYCTYENDYDTDNERLLSTCGIGSDVLDPVDADLYNGSYDINHPELSCTFTNTGEHSFYVYLQDEYNTLNFTQAKLVSISVINGTEGVTCSKPCVGTSCLPIKNNQGSDLETPESGTGLVGDPCTDDLNCSTGKCSLDGYCRKQSGNADCISDYQCISNYCVNGKCTKPTLFENIDTAVKEGTGDDPSSLNFLSFILLIGLCALPIIAGGAFGGFWGSIAGFFLGAIWYFGFGFFLVAIGYLSAFYIIVPFLIILMLTTITALVLKGN